MELLDLFVSRVEGRRSDVADLGVAVSELTTGMMVLIKDFSLIRRHDSEEEHYTSGFQYALVLHRGFRNHEISSGEIKTAWLVFSSRDTTLYYVYSDRLMTMDDARDPSRLFGYVPWSSE